MSPGPLRCDAKQQFGTFPGEILATGENEHPNGIVPVRVAASGGDVSPATKLKETERSHDEPFFLPDGKHFLYAVTPWRSPREIGVGELGKP
jgi:hypothetical protein